MATPGEKLAEALKALKKIQDKEIVAIRTSELSRTHRERLIKSGHLKEVLKGWYISVPSDEQQGDSTSWFASYWQFCSEYLHERYGDSYCISAEQSLQIHSGNLTVPHQLLIKSINGPNGKTPLPYETSLFTIKSSLPKSAELEEYEGIKLLTLPSSLIHASPIFFKRYPTDARTSLAMIKDSSEVLGLLLDGGHSHVASRLVGAFRNIGRKKIAEDIVDTMRKAGYVIREEDPFEDTSPIVLDARIVSPYANRISLMWERMRELVISCFPPAPGLPHNHELYMKFVEDIYVTDAYHSLSIERYRVSAELIERVLSGEWDLDQNEADREQKDAMAARGYWLATKKVRESIKKVLNGENSGKVVENDHGEWYRELFAPSVTANILKPSELAGYRTSQVYIGQSKHVPLNVDGLRDAMPVLFDLLKEEPEASVRAVLGHFVFVYIHPYMDGNGRMARFLMNIMFASGGYPWTVIPVEERNDYMNALEKASVDQDIGPFASYMAYLVGEGLKGNPIANVDNR